MNYICAEQQYLALLELLSKKLTSGKVSSDRTKVGTARIFNYQIVIDLAQEHNGLPLFSTKRLPVKNALVELMWFIKGKTNAKWLQERGTTFWDEWADDSGDVGPMYGAQWRNYNGTADQLGNVIMQLRHNPTSRRLLVSAWNPELLPVYDPPNANPRYGYMSLAPCHFAFQLFVEDGVLDLKFYQRSADVFLGLPVNMLSYSVLTHLIAMATNLKPGRVICDLGDTHLYSNHLDQALQQLSREILPVSGHLVVRKSLHPSQGLPALMDLSELEIHPTGSGLIDDLEIVGYQAQPSIKAPRAV